MFSYPIAVGKSIPLLALVLLLPHLELFLLHIINLGLLYSLSEKHLDMTLIDAPVLHSASTSRLLTLTLYMYSMMLSKLTSSIVTSLIF